MPYPRLAWAPLVFLGCFAGCQNPQPQAGDRRSTASEPLSRRTATPADPAADPLADAPPPPVPRDAIRSDVLLVNDQVVTVADVLDPVRERLTSAAATLDADAYDKLRADLVRQALIETIAERLIWQEARHLVSEDVKPQLDKTIEAMEKERINREFAGREALYDKRLAEQGRTRSEVREMLRRGIIVERYLRDRLLPLVPNPRKDELKRYYDEHVAEFTRQARRELFLIDVPVAAFLDARSPMTAQRLEAAEVSARKAINSAAEALRMGEPFEEVAKRCSRGLHREQGEAWGFIAEPLQGRWALPSKRLFEMTSGQVSEVIEDQRSFFIVRAGRVEEAKTLSFPEAQPQIARTLRQRGFARLRGKFLQEKLDQAQIGSLDDFYIRVLQAAPTKERVAKRE